MACGSEGYSLCVSEHSSDANADPANIIGYTEYRVWYGVVRRGGQWLDYELPVTGVRLRLRVRVIMTACHYCDLTQTVRECLSDPRVHAII